MRRFGSTLLMSRRTEEGRRTPDGSQGIPDDELAPVDVGGDQATRWHFDRVGRLGDHEEIHARMGQAGEDPVDGEAES